jgi:penicillin amidase
LLDGGVPKDDPRHDLKWFPRDGDQFSVDAANPGFSGTKFSYGSGPVMRMVVSLKGDEVKGQNIIPGGQSALTDSPFFADQARLWLANKTLPMRFSPTDVAAGAVSREVYRPKD